MIRYDVLRGCNTKQWWVYDNDNDTLIDPPSEVLDEVKQYEYEAQQAILEAIVQEAPDWLNDEDYTYDGELEV